MEHFEVAIIGGGVSALTSAILFAKRGKKTAIFEQAQNIVPLLCGFDRNDCHFETGFHYSGALGRDECGGHLFRLLDLDIPVELCDENGYDEMLLKGSQRVFKMPFGRSKIEQRLNDFFPKESKGIKNYLNLIEQTLSKSPFLNIHKKIFKNEEYFLLDDDKKTLKQVLDEHFESDEIKTLLSFSNILYGVPPSEVSFVFHCFCFGIMQESVWKIKGGGRTFAKEAQKSLKAKGASLFANKKVIKISLESDKKILRFKDGCEISADIVVSSISPKEFIKIAPDGVYRNAGIDRIENSVQTNGLFTLYGRFKQEYLRYKNINNLTATYPQDFKNDFKDAFYICFGDAGAITTALFVDSDEKLWDIPKSLYIEKKEKLAEKLKNKINQNFDELLSKIDFFEYSTPATMKRYVNYYGAYGFKHSIDSANIALITKIPGLYLIGQAVVTPGLLGAMISAFLLDKLLWKEDA